MPDRDPPAAILVVTLTVLGAVLALSLAVEVML
jgi:hypothetical protein